MPIIGWTMAVLLFWASVAGAVQQDAEPDESPEQILAFLIDVKVNRSLKPRAEESELGREHSRRVEIVRANPDLFRELIAARMQLPEVVPPEVGETEAWGRDFAVRYAARDLTVLLPAEQAASLLARFFVQARRLLEQSIGLSAETRAKRVERGEMGELDPGDAATLQGLARLRTVLTGGMTRAIEIASTLRTPALVDPMLEFYEAGLRDNQWGWAKYPLLFAQEREDVIPRLERLMEDPKIDRHVRIRIRRALEAYAKSLVEAEGEEGAAGKDQVADRK